MADTVQYLLEEQFPELEDFERKGYFSKAELKAVLQKRQDFEYRLKRRAALKQDYYRYIDYEMKLEKLRRIRKQKLGIQGKKSISETAIVKRVHFIFERASRKFKGDLQLWLDWLAYCKKTKASKQHSKVVTRALQRHATAPVLWIEAAQWDFEHAGNVAAARALMQQGLRMCKHEVVMWVEYLRMELLYIQRLRMRREVLGLDVPDEEMDASDVPPGSDWDESGAAVNAVLTGAVARIVLKSAMAAIPGSLGLRKKMLEVLALFDFPGTQSLEDQVYSSVASDFATDEDAWDLMARRPLAAAARAQQADMPDDAGPGPASSVGRTLSDAQLKAHAAVLELYERAVAAVKTERMYDLFAAYLEGRLEQLMSMAAAATASSSSLPEASTSGHDQQQAGARGNKRRRGDVAAAGGAAELVDLMAAAGVELLAVFLSAHKQRCAPVALYVRWVGWAQRLGQAQMAVAAARHGCARHGTHAELWSLRLTLEVDARAPELLGLFRTAVGAVPSGDSCGLWLLMLERVDAGSGDFQHLVDLLVTAATAAPSTAGLGRVVAACLARVRTAQGLDHARAFYRRFLTLPAADAAYFLAAIDMEHEEEGASGCAKAPHGASAKASATRVLFEAAVSAHGSKDAELWLRYAMYEAEARRGGGSIYWRAVKALHEPEAFILAYRERLQEEP